MLMLTVSRISEWLSRLKTRDTADRSAIQLAAPSQSFSQLAKISQKTEVLKQYLPKDRSIKGPAINDFFSEEEEGG